MAIEVILPKIDEAMKEGTILEWKRREGEQVEKGDILYVLETEKVTWEVEAPESGILSRPIFNAGDVVPVGTVVALILQPGEEPPETQTRPKADTSESPVPPTGREAQEVPELVKAATATRASPVAKRIAKEHGIDLSLIKGTGPEGRITKEDIMQAVEQAPQSGAATAVHREIVPFSSMRRTIARRMSESFRTAPHFYLSMEVDVKELSYVREKLIPQIEKTQGLRLTYTDLLVKVTAQALEEHPEINVTISEDGIKRLNDVNLGLAIAVEQGLIVPVIRQANTRSLVEIVAIRADLTRRASQGKIGLDEMRDSSITLTNLGMFDVDQFDAIINPPESCILAVGRITDKPVADQGQVVIRPRMNLTLSIDHRVLDGVSGSRFLHRIKELIEQPMLMIL